MIFLELGGDKTMHVERSEKWVVDKIILDTMRDRLGNSDCEALWNAESTSFGKNICAKKDRGGGGIFGAIIVVFFTTFTME